MFTLLSLWELKNEIGTGGSDPFTQGGFSFSRWWSSNYVCSRNHLRHGMELTQDQLPSAWHGRGLCSSFLLLIAGPWVSVHGGILLGTQWIIQPLTDFVWTGTGPDIEQSGQVARVAATLRIHFPRLCQ